jgi:hypothetical protein
MNIDGDLRLILCFIDTATHCKRRKISFHTVCAICGHTEKQILDFLYHRNITFSVLHSIILA